MEINKLFKIQFSKKNKHKTIIKMNNTKSQINKINNINKNKNKYKKKANRNRNRIRWKESINK